MNGPHDIGGLMNLGPIIPEAEGEPFHADWERRVFAVTLAAAPVGGWAIDASRHEEPWQTEVFAMTAGLVDADQLTWAQWSQALGTRLAEDTPAYYDAWLAALEDVVAAAGLVGSDDLTARQQAWREAAATTPHGRPVELPSDR